MSTTNSGPRSPSRRSLLKRGLLGGGLLFIGGFTWLGTRGTQRGAPSPKPLSVLTDDEYAVMQAIAARIVAPAPDAPPLGDAVWTVDQLLAVAPVETQKEVKQLLGLFENALGNLLFGGRATPFTHLDPADQTRVLREWQQSRLLLRRTGYSALKTLALAGYYASPRTWAYMNYPGPPSAFHDPNAPVWKGGGQPRPDSPGVWKPEESEGTLPHE